MMDMTQFHRLQPGDKMTMAFHKNPKPSWLQTQQGQGATPTGGTAQPQAPPAAPPQAPPVAPMWAPPQALPPGGLHSTGLVAPPGAASAPDLSPELMAELARRMSAR